MRVSRSSRAKTKKTLDTIHVGIMKSSIACLLALEASASVMRPNVADQLGYMVRRQMDGYSHGAAPPAAVPSNPLTAGVLQRVARVKADPLQAEYQRVVAEPSVVAGVRDDQGGTALDHRVAERLADYRGHQQPHPEWRALPGTEAGQEAHRL